MLYTLQWTEVNYLSFSPPDETPDHGKPLSYCPNSAYANFYRSLSRSVGKRGLNSGEGKSPSIYNSAPILFLIPKNE